MWIAITGSSGLVGQALIPALEKRGHRILRLKRGESWDAALAHPVQAVIHLAGEGIAKRRWTAAQKAKIRESRVLGTQELVQKILCLPAKPSTFISASAIGFYGDRGNTLLDETSIPGKGFLAEVSQEWESAATPLKPEGIRTVQVRIGIVLSRFGGALPVMRRPFLFGVGGPIGDGTQFMSWIALTDLVALFVRAVEDAKVSGPVNAVSPYPVTNAEFSRTLARVLHRPCLFRLPVWAARLAVGEMADALLLSSMRVDPAVLRRHAYPFQYPELEAALRHELGLNPA